MKDKIQENPEWNKIPCLQVKHCEFNYDKSLIIFATNYGYRVFETEHFKLVSKIDNVQEMIGQLTKASILYNSKLICFLGDTQNLSFPKTQLVFWDESKQKKLGILILKENIDTFYLTKNVIITITKNKILLFELATLKFITKIDNIVTDENLFTYLDNNPLTLGYVSSEYSNLNIISLIKFKIDNSQRKVVSRNRIGVITQFEKIKYIKFPIMNDEVIVCCSQYENKIHVYSTFDNLLLYCIYLGQAIISLSNLYLDNKIKFLLFVVDNEEMHLYKLKGNQEKYACDCKKHLDSDVKNTRKGSTNSFFGGLISKMFDDTSEQYLTLNLNENQRNLYLVEIDNVNKNYITLVNNEGKVNSIIFDRKDGAFIKNEKEYNIFEVSNVNN